MKFYTQYERPKESHKEIPWGESLVETAGYIPAKQRIESIIDAGRRLKEYRASQFDFEEGKVEEDFQDPTRTKGYDLSDASREMERLDQKKSQLKKELKENADKIKDQENKKKSKKSNEEAEVSDGSRDTGSD